MTEQQVQAAFEDEGKDNVEEDNDTFFKKRIIFIRHGNSIWNKMKGQGAAAKISA